MYTVLLDFGWKRGPRQRSLMTEFTEEGIPDLRAKISRPVRFRGRFLDFHIL